MKHVIALLTFLFSLPVFAQQDYLSDLDQYLGVEVFESAFVVGDRYSYHENECLGRSVCDDVDRFWSVESVDVSAAKLLTRTGAKGNPMPSEVTVDRWLKNHGNPVRFLIEVAESYGQQVEILALREEKISIKAIPQEISALRIDLKISNQMGEVGTRSLFLYRDLPGLMKVVKRLEFDRMTRATRSIELTEINLSPGRQK